jgi:hypothetical protein
MRIQPETNRLDSTVTTATSPHIAWLVRDMTTAAEYSSHPTRLTVPGAPGASLDVFCTGGGRVAEHQPVSFPV